MAMTEPDSRLPMQDTLPRADISREQPTTQPLSLIPRLFKGQHGLRAGWRLLLYLLMGAAVVVTLVFILQPWRSHGAARLWLQLAQETMLTLAVIIPAFVMAQIEKRSFGDYGLPAGEAFGKLFWTGCFWGLLAISFLLLMLRGLHGFYFGHLALHGVRILKFAVFWGLFFLLVGFFEEFLFRGYTLSTLTTGMGFWPTAIILSAAFGAVHSGNPGEAGVGLLSAGLIGFFFLPDSSPHR